jgi:hypothetical protein
MENKEKDYKEERFEFALYVNDNIICKRNFRIYNFIENSMSTLEFKEKVDEIVKLIDNDLKSKSRVYTWYYFNPAEQDETDEFHSDLIEPWSCTFKLVISDNKREIISKIWDGYAYPKAIREKVDLSNKNVKVTTRDGQTYSYDKESFFKTNDGRLSFEQEVLKAMISDKQDVLLQITKKICEACSPSKAEIKERGHFDPKENAKYLSKYTVFDNYGDKKYSYSIYLANKKVEKEWEKAVMDKTKAYFKNMF